MHAPRTILVLVLVITLLSLWTACGRKGGTPTSPRPNPPVCSVSPTSLDFGEVRLGGAADRTFTITNAGGGTLADTLRDTCAAFTIVGSRAYSLGANQSAQFTVRFSPISEGAQSGSILTGTSGCSPVVCSGTAPSKPACSIWPPTLGFGSVRVYQTKDLQFTVTNSGGGTLAGTLADTCADFHVVGNASYSLRANQSATFTVRFAPSRDGTQSGYLGTGSPVCDEVFMAGTGTFPPGPEIAHLDFGRVAVGQTAQRQFTAYSSVQCGSDPYGVCAITVTDTLFRVVGAYAGSPSYRCDTNYSVRFPITYTVLFMPQEAGIQRAVVELRCESVEYAGYVGYGYVTCTGVGY